MPPAPPEPWGVHWEMGLKSLSYMLRIFRTGVRVLSTREEGRAMMPKRATEPRETLLPDEEIQRRHAEDPEVMRRAEEAAERARRGEPAGDRITAEELPDFLREHG